VRHGLGWSVNVDCRRDVGQRVDICVSVAVEIVAGPRSIGIVGYRDVRPGVGIDISRSVVEIVTVRECDRVEL
jgi:hypothetical protein